MANFNGNCYICGKTFSKTGMRTHIIKKHGADGLEKCFLVKAEGFYNNDYWLLFDIPQTATFSEIDQFLRDIWMECCGHMSIFYTKPFQEIEHNQSLYEFSPTARGPIYYDYDMGSTTSCFITYLGETYRRPEEKAVRLLARNEPFNQKCNVCGKKAVLVCSSCIYSSGDSVFCEECGKKHEHNDWLLPLTNSPRNGECGYGGEQDVYTFDINAFILPTGDDQK